MRVFSPPEEERGRRPINDTVIYLEKYCYGVMDNNANVLVAAWHMIDGVGVIQVRASYRV